MTMSNHGVDKEANLWAMFLHLSSLAGCIIPLAGFIAPIVIWQIKKDESPMIDEHGKIVVNWIISSVIYGCICLLLSFLLIGIPLLFVLALLSLIFPIIGGVKANNGELWKYPLTIQFLK
jgi:uncharacterized protein